MKRIDVDGTRTEFTLPPHGDAARLKAMQEAVGGYVEVVAIPDGRSLVMDEDGMAKRLPRNVVANQDYGQYVFGELLGTVLVAEKGELR